MEYAWTDEHRIGVEEIDSQHIDFIKLLNRFNIVFASGRSIAFQDRLLLEILKYFEYHSVSEENLMIIYKYPEANKHAEMHKMFINKLQDDCHAIKSGRINGTDIIKHLYDYWFLRHTQYDDRLFAEHLMRIKNQVTA